MTTPIIFIGPVRAGKTTLAHLLSSRLSLPHVSLDEIRWEYYHEIGYDDQLAKKIRAEGGFLALVFYRQLFDPYAMERALGDYPEAVIDCGAGVGPYENRLQFDNIHRLIKPIANIFLLVPSPEVDESLRILKERDINPPADLKFDINSHFLKHPGYRILTKHVIYNKDNTPEQSISEVLKLIK